MLFPGETKYHTFTLPYAADNVDTVIVSYKQRDRILIEKEAGDKEAIDESTCRVSVS